VIPILAYFTAALTFGVGYVLGRRACPEDETYNRGWLDGYAIGKRIPKMDTPADEPVPPMVNTTTSAALTPVTMIHTPKRPPANKPVPPMVETSALKPAKRQVTRKPRVKK